MRRVRACFQAPLFSVVLGFGTLASLNDVKSSVWAGWMTRRSLKCFNKGATFLELKKAAIPSFSHHLWDKHAGRCCLLRRCCYISPYMVLFDC